MPAAVEVDAGLIRLNAPYAGSLSVFGGTAVVMADFTGSLNHSGGMLEVLGGTFNLPVTYGAGGLRVGPNAVMAGNITAEFSGVGGSLEIARTVNGNVGIDDNVAGVLAGSAQINGSVATGFDNFSSVEILLANGAPTINPGEWLLLDVLANDRSLVGAPLVIESVGPAANGQTSVRGGAVSYTPDPGFTGMDWFSYQISGGEHVASGVVTVEVSPEIAPPVPISAIASSHDGNVPANTLDGSPATRWSAFGIGEWIQFDFGTEHILTGIFLAFFNGDSRVSTFEVIASDDGVLWKPVLLPTSSSGTTTGLQDFDFLFPVFARYVRVIGQGNNQSAWNSFTMAAFSSIRNVPPVAPDLVISTPEAVATSVDLLAEAFDTDGLPRELRIAHTGSPLHAGSQLDGPELQLFPVPGFTGSESFVYQVSDGHRITESMVTLNVTGSTTFEGFRNVHFTAAERDDPAISGPDADPDGDGIPNLVEFAMGLDPRVPSGLAPLEHDGNMLHLVYQVNAGAAGVELVAEWSENLVDWTSDGLVVELLSEAGNIRTYRAGLGTGDHISAFLRLQARQP